MVLLAIESSCDESAVALLEQYDSGVVSVRAELISSQIDTHRLYGGVVPEIASREHLKALPVLVKQVVQKADCQLSDLSAIAVTQGPGLKGCLLMGICFARGLAHARRVPLFGVHHIEGHILAPLLDNPDLQPPYLALVVSGGHTEIIQVDAIGSYRVLARTSDDAAGEAFDKSAHLLGFPYPGGAQLAALADTVTASRFKLPKVMREAPGFSFSGLKTAVSLLIKKQAGELEDPLIRAELAFAIQAAIVDALCFKLKKAIKETGIKTVALTGGVAANSFLRTMVSSLTDSLYAPHIVHCTDNAAMIGYTALAREHVGLSQGNGKAVFARLPVEQEMPQ